MNVLKQKLYRTQLNNQGNTMRNLALLSRWQWLDERRMAAMQRQRLSDLLIHAYHYVPFYRQRLEEAGVCDGFSVNLDRFGRLALLDKADIRDRLDEMKSADLEERRWYFNTSGGSTGDPVRFIQDKEYADWTAAVKLLDDSWSGRRMGDRQIRLWGSERDLLVGRESLKTYVGRWVKNEIHLNAFRMTETQMDRYLRTIDDFKPVQILAYADSIDQLAQHAERTGTPAHRPRAIMTSAGTLFRPMRERIERTFGCPVFDRYGSREVGDIACECDHHEGLHVSVPTHYVEILGPGGRPAAPGETGEIVVTLLTNYAMPIIRYRIGDLGAWAEGKCPCGRSYPLIGQLAGRVTDTFVTRSGTRVHGEYFTHLFYFQDWVKQFQVIQEDYARIRVVWVPGDRADGRAKPGERAISDIAGKIRLVMGGDCQVIFEERDDIPPSPSGKFRYTLSRVAEAHFAGENAGT
ncbi:phenylacetate--CoA ligase family protein [Cohnella caldifontis]|uniref:phenylacetate--CoA ligase family protein n=1 Tax=Cohnella caldifontis TaxID=3027471 RepID=UPI0023ED6BC5|nr:hypothetical protein [Cohnella sp. YIM B05605]